MSENKFIKRLKGEQTAKSVLEIKNESAKTSFANMPQGTSNAINVYSDHRGNATVVANGTMNWKVDSLQTLTPANIVNGNGQDFTTSMATSGAGLWINAEYIFPSTGDPNHPVAMVFNPQTKWVLKVCGDNLLSPTRDTIDFTVLITFGSSNIISKTFTVAEQANKFCKELVIDFAESNTNIIKAQGLSSMKLQLLCGTADASANIYGGMTVLTCLQRKVEAVAISSTFANVEEVLRDGLLPNDYFSNGAYIAQVTDGDTAYAVFQRDGDEMLFVGWNQPIPDQTGNSGKFLMTNGSLMSWEQLTISDVDGLQDDLDDLQDQITDNKDIMDDHIADTNNPHSVTKAQVGLGNVDNTSDADKPISTATQTALDGKVDKNADITGATKCKITYDNKGLVTAGADLAESDIPSLHLSKISDVTATVSEINVLDGITASTTELNYVDGVTSAIQTQIDGKQAKSASDYNMGNSTGGWTAMTTAQQNALNSGATTTNIGQIATNTSNIANEIIDRQNADNGLQGQIDAIVSKSDVVDIVGTYAELQAYDTTGLGNNDVVKVISDSTHNDAPSYYRWVITGGVGAWVYIGSESETYTKAETDALLNAKQDVLTAGSNITISGSTISATDTTYTGSDGITLTGTNFTNSGVRSVVSGSTNGTISVNTNGTSADVAVYGLGSAAYTASTAYATSAQGALADTAVQPGDLATVATTGDYTDLLNKPTIPTVDQTYDATSANAQSGVAINGANFLVNNAAGSTNGVAIKGSGSIQSTQIGALGSAVSMSTSVGFSCFASGTQSIAVGHGSQATASKSYALGEQAKSTAIGAFQFGQATNSEAGSVYFGLTTDGNTTTNYKLLGSDGIVPDARISSNIARTSDLATVATSGNYNDLSNKPTIPTVNDATITITQGGVTKGSFTLNQSSGDTIALDAGGGGGGSSLDAGFIAPFAGSTAPSGWLVCDGSAVSRSTYSDLFDAIGTTYGSGDGSTTFNLPDLSGKLPLYDSGATLGTTTNGKAPNITYSASGNIGCLYTSTGALQTSAGQGKRTTSNGSDWNYYSESFDASRSSSVYDNNATGILPAGVYTLWCIKY